MKWFKFYGQDFLTDPKMRMLTIEEKMCWIVLMCLANAEDKDGDVDFISEEEIMHQAAVDFGSPMWVSTIGFVDHFVALRLLQIRNTHGVTGRGKSVRYDVTLTNFSKRQETNLTPAERQKNFRERHKQAIDEQNNDSNVDKRNDSNARTDKNRVDKKRIEKREEKPESSIKYLSKIPKDVLEELSVNFQCSTDDVSRVGRKIVDYCASKGKVYKDYKATLRNWLRSEYRELTDEEKAKNADIQARVLNLKKKMTI